MPQLLEPAVFSRSLRAALEGFRCAGGRRTGSRIAAGRGVRFSSVQHDDSALLLARPPPACLFDVPQDGDVLTLRLSLGGGGERPRASAWDGGLLLCLLLSRTFKRRYTRCPPHSGTYTEIATPSAQRLLCPTQASAIAVCFDHALCDAGC